MNEEMDLEVNRITITRTISEHGHPEVNFEFDEDLDWVTALGMLAAAQAVLVDGMPDEEEVQ